MISWIGEQKAALPSDRAGVAAYLFEMASRSESAAFDYAGRKIDGGD